MASLDMRSRLDDDRQPELRTASPRMEEAIAELLGNDRDRIERGSQYTFEKAENQGMTLREAVSLIGDERILVAPILGANGAMKFALTMDTSTRMETIERNMQAYEAADPEWMIERADEASH